MKNYYLIAGIIVAVVLVGVFIINKQKGGDLKKNTDINISNNANNALVDGNYKIDLENSVIKWVGEYAIGGINHKGTLKLSSGNVVMKNGSISGDFVINMNTLAEDSGNAKLVGHLKSDDFFSVEKFPEAKFVLKSFEPSSADSYGRYLIGGDLTIKGITKPVYFTASVGSEKDVVSAKASFAINRADWQIKYNSPSFFKDIGDKAIRDAVEIELDLKAIKVLQ